MIEKRHFYIDGTWVGPHLPRDHAVIDPSTEEPCAVISLGDRADTEAAVAAALRAGPGWAATPPAERLAAVERILTIYQARAEEMAQAMSLEMGAPIDFARENQVGAGIWHISNFIRAAKDFKWVHPLGDGTPGAMIAYEPVGVVGLITPWNWPMNQVTLKVIPALIAGCTMVLKPSEEAPLSSLLFAEFVHAAGVPAGVFNLVNGDGLGVGTQLSTHPDVEMISFTGSTRAGKAITQAAASTLKRVCLELGGKGANLVFADADENAVARGVRHCMNNSGQSCNAPTRMLVERPLYDRAVEIAAEVAAAIKVAPAQDPGRHIGPVVNAAQFEKIQSLIETGIKEGARLVAGGLGRPEGLNKGFFIRPTVFADVTPEMTVMREEIFGPVLSIMPFDTEAEAIAIANATPYGLTNYVQSQDGARRNRLARQLRSGMVEMNGQSRGAGAPFGGVRASGRAREGGRWGIEEFCEVKSISGWAG
ncbi:aldehyde dehydrogenase family protein [Rhodobacter capsulatus]|uniref:aldehyde dehydrogenase family protein n=1 Tax=Rhodobacter capsulatus TaxID=1061 RepID=UPI0006DC9F4E|nr:aldehyde dehydrogenase family protein [Rhodobacter capsulatus]KQB11398.1 aldehyde dehydrogenase [Rhodobacter capsulatus]KQB16800.1 aldehyde dehydrogenase [Rhodobacter capsulatus]PZX22949.1 aldehyde dehydrogenase (NAD+) [Rhodobacter capsulatus]QNR63529.1 aldehyde dehydrogenase family protein [Rhodobacter capsulatus]